MRTRSSKKTDYFEDLTWREVTRDFQGYQKSKQRALLEIISRFFKLLILLGICFVTLLVIGGIAFDFAREAVTPSPNSPK